MAPDGVFKLMTDEATHWGFRDSSKTCTNTFRALLLLCANDTAAVPQHKKGEKLPLTHETSNYRKSEESRKSKKLHKGEAEKGSKDEEKKEKKSKKSKPRAELTVVDDEKAKADPKKTGDSTVSSVELGNESSADLGKIAVSALCFVRTKLWVSLEGG